MQGAGCTCSLGRDVSAALVQPGEGPTQQSVRASTHPGIQRRCWNSDTISRRGDRVSAQARTQGSAQPGGAHVATPDGGNTLNTTGGRNDASCQCHCRANSVHMRQSRPDSGLGSNHFSFKSCKVLLNRSILSRKLMPCA